MSVFMKNYITFGGVLLTSPSSLAGVEAKPLKLCVLAGQPNMEGGRQ